MKSGILIIIAGIIMLGGVKMALITEKERYAVIGGVFGLVIIFFSPTNTLISYSNISKEIIIFFLLANLIVIFLICIGIITTEEILKKSKEIIERGYDNE